MVEQEVECQDGTDPQCEETVIVKLDREYSQEEIDEMIRDLKIDEPICGACGSDHTRNDEGEIVQD